jgi:hypothetical protein
MPNHNCYPLSSLSKQDVRVLIMDRRVERDVRRPKKWETPHSHPSNDPQTSQAPMALPIATPMASATEMMQNDPAPSTHPQPCEPLLAGWIAGADTQQQSQRQQL